MSWCSRQESVSAPRFDKWKWGLTLFLTVSMPMMISACGFHLRGTVDLPAEVKSIYIQSEDRYSPFYRELVAMIKQNDLGPTGDPGSADVVIQVLSDETDRRIMTVSARNLPREYEVYYIVNCSVFVRGEQIIDRQRLILTRDYTYDETQVLGKANEEVVLTNALAKDLVSLLVQTISASYQQQVETLQGG